MAEDEVEMHNREHELGAAEILDAFFDDIKRMRMDAGNPAYEKIAREAQCSHDTVHRLIAKRQLISQHLAVNVAVTLGGDRNEWQARWSAAKLAENEVRQFEESQRRSARREPWPAKHSTIRVARYGSFIAICMTVIILWIYRSTSSSDDVNLTCARVISPSAHVYKMPSEKSHVLKTKYQGDKISLYSGVKSTDDQGVTLIAVRTPRDFPGFAWMKRSDLKAASCDS